MNLCFTGAPNNSNILKYFITQLLYYNELLIVVKFDGLYGSYMLHNFVYVGGFKQLDEYMRNTLYICSFPK